MNRSDVVKSEKTLANATDAELREELVTRKVEYNKSENEKREVRRQLVLTNVDLLLALAPEHNRSDCSDTNLKNATNDHQSHCYRCLRCQLLYLKTQNWNDEYALRFELEYTPDLPTSRVDLERTL